MWVSGILKWVRNGFCSQVFLPCQEKHTAYRNQSQCQSVVSVLLGLCRVHHKHWWGNSGFCLCDRRPRKAIFRSWQLLEKCKSKLYCSSAKLQTTMTSHQSERLLLKCLQITNVRESVEKREPSYTVGGNVNCDSHYGKQYRVSS